MLIMLLATRLMEFQEFILISCDLLYFEGYLNELQVGISYDVNTSAFHTVTDRKGGPEFSVIYIITHVKPLSQFKACPIF